MSHQRWNDIDPDEPHGESPMDDREGPQPRDLGGSGNADEYDLVPCPHCGGEISELAEQCPHCGDWIVQDAGAGSRRSPLLIAIAILLLIVFLLWAL
jgi:rRNA maturation protein Nop10